MSDFCRAITFINYHIPISPGNFEEMEYSTIGFFDGMSTKRIEFEYRDVSLKELWQYNLRCSSKEEGKYSYQNVFCFSSDAWNKMDDIDFWSDATNSNYPLTFVVFLQLQNYMVGEKNIGDQCTAFAERTKTNLGNKGVAYAYGTVDKNDFVICIKCRSYKTAVDAIKALHQMETIVYSYTIFSVPSDMIMKLRGEKYADVYNEILPSICLKGVTNTYDPMNKYTLTDKYYELCENLATAFYGDEKEEKRKNREYKIYDILGDDDFRLIARDVRLGVLLEQYGPGGVLSYEEPSFQFCLFSSNMVLNIDTPDGKMICEKDRDYGINKMTTAFSTPVCDKLQEKMKNILEMIYAPNSPFGEKTVTFCYAMWQLLRSLKALEAAPTKKYDFFTLYHPFSLLVDIIKEKMEKALRFKAGSEYVVRLENNSEIYDFIHKISMTLHGTLRTDIQFFQIKDFNVIVHYAPAKLRAFYAIWTLELADYYNSFGSKKNEYSFIFAPGMFRDISVKELFVEYDATKHLMLIVLPERNLYSPEWLLITLAHEVSHFVGSTVRNRPARHSVFLQCVCRVLELEIRHFIYIVTDSGLQNEVESYIKDDQSLLEDMIEQINHINAVKEKGINSEEKSYMFHSKNSIKRICLVLREYGASYLQKSIADEVGSIGVFLEQEAVKQGICKDQKDRIDFHREILKMSDSHREQLAQFFQTFQSNALEQILGIIKFILTESCADLNAVLTNSLSPMEYIHSFVDKNNDLRDGLNDSGNTSIRTVRVGLVLKAVENLVSQNKDWFHENEPLFFETWNSNVIDEIVKNTNADGAEGRFAKSIKTYVSQLRMCSDSISEYRSLYNDSPDVMAFTNSELDFLNDFFIWDTLIGYLDKCARDYVDVLQKFPKTMAQKQKLSSIYRKAKKGPATELMMNVESFLQQYEERHKRG